MRLTAFRWGLVRERAGIRLGTRFILENGADVSVLELILANGGMVCGEHVRTAFDGPDRPFHWTFTPNLPKPEDYVLQRSATSLEDIYRANEWEAARPAMSVPMPGYDGGEAEAAISDHPAITQAAPVNMPLSLRLARSGTEDKPPIPKLREVRARARESSGRGLAPPLGRDHWTAIYGAAMRSPRRGLACGLGM